MTITSKERRLYQQIILSRSKNPRHFGKTNPVDRFQKLANPYCQDTIEITLTLEDRIIKDLKFKGSGCALCLASADLMVETIKEKTIDESQEIVEHFHQVMLSKTELNPSLNLLKAVEGAKRYPVKIKCVILPWHSFKMAISNC